MRRRWNRTSGDVAVALSFGVLSVPRARAHVIQIGTACGGPHPQYSHDAGKEALPTPRSVGPRHLAPPVSATLMTAPKVIPSVPALSTSFAPLGHAAQLPIRLWPQHRLPSTQPASGCAHG